MYDMMFEGVRVVDGTGRVSYSANVATIGDTIALIGTERVRARTHVSGNGLVLTPGFIDIHAHSEFYALDGKTMRMRIGQGITTDVSGNCGVGVFPLNENRDLLRPLCDDVLGKHEDRWDWDDFSSFRSRLASSGHGINMMFLQAHAPLRVAVMGASSDRAATEDEIRQMCDLLDRSLSEGCAGFSTGLYYQPCFSADDRELEALLEVVRRHDALFAVHMRSEGDEVLESLEEVLELSLKTGCRIEVSHLKAIGRENQAKATRMLEMIHSYRDRGLDAGFDQYPYNYGSTSLFSLLPPEILALSRTEMRFALQLDSEREMMKREILNPHSWESIYHQSGPDAIRILHLDSRNDLDGLNLSQVSAKLDMDDPLDALFDVLSEESGAAIMCDVTQSQETLEKIMLDPLMTFSTDALYSSESVHERSHSAAIELIGKYVLEKKLMSLEEAVSRMTYRNAVKLSLPDRGVIKEGSAADLVLLDTATLSPSWHDGVNDGVKMVVINGQPAFVNGQYTDSLRGRVLVSRK